MSIETINLKFRTGNGVQVRDTRITREEWEEVLREVGLSVHPGSKTLSDEHKGDRHDR